MERKNIYIELLDRFMRGELPAEQEHELRTNNLKSVSCCFNIIDTLGQRRRERNLRPKFRIGCSGIFRAGYMQQERER